MRTVVCDPSITLGGTCLHSHFADEETKAQSGLVTYQISHSKWHQDAHWLFSSQTRALFTALQVPFIIHLSVMSTHFILQPFAKYLWSAQNFSNYGDFVKPDSQISRKLKEIYLEAFLHNKPLFHDLLIDKAIKFCFWRRVWTEATGQAIGVPASQELKLC